ncbi:sensor domain CHASE2-containing protein [Desulfocicer vacuolatum DSM 3385]|uniref:Sensor domain CHASE2-containing protein n=2 Tax=Desulfocicer vacuolatum TaxID=2298 RepID=A0A1W2A2L5_9BACT|nr:sensor domain CHASE2-containing protein [Desulfocicer vacuolatum DSM 3385]
MDKKPRYIAVYMGFTTVLLVWVLSLAGFFNFPNNIFYDAFVKLQPASTHNAEKVMIMEVSYDQHHQGDKEWLTILTRLKNAGVSQVIFSFFPPMVSENFYDTAAAMENVIFGRQLFKPKDPTESEQFAPIPSQARGKQIVMAPYEIPPDHYGVHRMGRSYFNINHQKTPSFLMEAATKRGIHGLPEEDIFSINFMGAMTKLPNIDFEKTLSGNVIAELVKNRSIIIGLKKMPNSPGFQTPIHSGKNSISLVEYHGYILDTLIEQKPITCSRPLTTLLFIILITILGLTAYTLLNGTMAFIFTILFFVASFVLNWFILSYTLFWPPLFEIIITEAIVINFIFLRTYVSKTEFLKKMILARSNQMQKHFLPTGFYASKDYWTSVINMVNQTLNLERVIFLEKVRNDHRVKEIIALNTSIKDIEERRRDYERTPYSTAIEENSPIQIKSYFKKVKKEDEQYIVPLIFEGQIQGFWAFVISSSNADEINNLLPAIQRFALEIAEILYKRAKWRIAQAGKKKVINKILRLEAKENLYQEVSNTIRMLGRRLSVLDLVFNSLASAIVLYDIFGQVTHINEGMIQTLKKINITTPFKMSALDLAVQLTNHSTEEIRNLLNQIILNHDNVNLPVNITNHKKAYMLTIRPLIDEKKNFLKDEAYPFDLHGILFEMNDVTDIKDFISLKADFFQRSNARLKDGVESITNACMMLEENDMVADEKKDLVKSLKGKKEDMIDFMNELDDYMGKDIFSENRQLFPIIIMKILTAAMGSMGEEAAKRQLIFDVKPDTMPNMTIANPLDLKKIFTSLLFILLQDAYEETTIHIKVESRKNHLLYILYNSGYGMPDEDFQRYLSSKHLTDSKAFKTLHEMLPTLKRWKGELTGKSGVGDGIEFHLRLIEFKERRRTPRHA